MVAIFIITLASFFASRFFLERNKKVFIIASIICLVSFGWLFMSLLTPFDAEKVACIYVDVNGEATNEHKSLYVEDESGRYFVTEFNDWNLFEPTYRKYLDTQKAEKYIEAYKQLMSTNPY